MRKPMRLGQLPYRLEKQVKAVDTPSAFTETVLGLPLYKKQREALDAILPEGSAVSVACCNSGGKTSRIVAGAALWHQWMFPGGKVKATSGSFTQIEDQLWPAVKAHKDKFPRYRWYETPEFTSRCPITGKEGFFKAFKTNEPGRAEGDHGEGTPDMGMRGYFPLLYIVDEAKTAPDWLRGVIEGRVRPNRLLLLSSHGYAEGWFWETQRILKERYHVINIQAEDCKHITAKEIRDVENTWRGVPGFADALLGRDFLQLIENAVIDGKALDDNLAHPPKRNLEGDVHAFCDFAWSGSGDENVLALRRGNAISLEGMARFDSLYAIVDWFIAHFARLGLRSGQISGDEGGGGKLIMDALDDRGWVLARVNNGFAASDSEHYANVAAETWYEGGKHITAKSFILPVDQILRGQLLNRKRMPNMKGKLGVEIKEAMRARGIPSPDRADSVLGSMLPIGGVACDLVSFAQAMPVGRYRGGML